MIEVASRLKSALAVVCLAAFGGIALLAQQARDEAAPVIRALVQAIYANDVAAYEKLTLPHPLRSRLTAGGKVNEERLRELEEDPGGLQIRQTRPLAYQGKSVTPAPNGQYPAGTTGRYMVAHHGQPMIVGVVRQRDGGKVDLRWWIAMADLMSGREPDRNGPEFAIRSLLFAMLRLDRTGAAQYLTDAKAIDFLFVDAPRQREPSGVLEATVAEMPLVVVAPGEFFPMPSNRIVEGVNAPDRQVVVGWFGPVEIPFVVRRTGGGWRVEAEPYFVLLNQ